MKALKCEIYLYVPDTIGEKEVAKALAQSQIGHDLAADISDKLEITGQDFRIKFSGMVY